VIVTDSSVLTEAFTKAKRGLAARAELARDVEWLAPAHWKIEVVSAVRGLVHGREIPEEAGLRLVRQLPTLRISTVQLDELLPRIWELHGRMTPYDAAYVAAAEAHACPLVTADARLARAGGLRCEIRLVSG
jgi:predicted nucleic acid-binding protein